MTATLTEPVRIELGDAALMQAISKSVEKVLPMCGLTARCVSISTVPNRHAGNVTGMIGVHGKVSGFATVNVSQRSACRIVGGMLGEEYERLCADVVDGFGEFTNMISGAIKGGLAGSDWAISQITVPSVIVGEGYDIAYAHGLNFASASFEIDDPESFVLGERLMHVSVSLLRL